MEAGHHWVAGLLLLQELQPDALRGEKLTATLQRQAETLDGLDLDRQLPRSLGWGLMALSASALRPGARCHQTVRVLRRWREYVLGTQTSSGLLALVPLSGGGHLAVENPFVQGGIILPALVRSLRAAPSARAARGTARLARALGRSATRTDRDGTVLPLRITLDVRSGRVIARSGRAPGEHAALFLAGLGAADPKLLRTPSSVALMRSVPSTLRCDRKVYIGAELSILLRALPGLR